MMIIAIKRLYILKKKSLLWYVEAHFWQSSIREKTQQQGQTKVSKQEKTIEPKWQEWMAHGAHKVGPEEANGPKWTREERGSKLMGNM